VPRSVRCRLFSELQCTGTRLAHAARSLSARECGGHFRERIGLRIEGGCGGLFRRAHVFKRAGCRWSMAPVRHGTGIARHSITGAAAGASAHSFCPTNSPAVKSGLAARNCISTGIRRKALVQRSIYGRDSRASAHVLRRRRIRVTFYRRGVAGGALGRGCSQGAAPGAANAPTVDGDVLLDPLPFVRPVLLDGSSIFGRNGAMRQTSH